VPPAPPLPRHDVPAFLQRQKRAVLDTGKYLNVMRQCGAEPPRTLPPGTRLGEALLPRGAPALPHNRALLLLAAALASRWPHLVEVLPHLNLSS
jgi:hypothetical protein